MSYLRSLHVLVFLQPNKIFFQSTPKIVDVLLVNSFACMHPNSLFPRGSADVPNYFLKRIFRVIRLLIALEMNISEVDIDCSAVTGLRYGFKRLYQLEVIVEV